MIAGPLLTAVAFTLWVAAPGYWVFALGFVLWGLKSALTSGALEALVYEELQRLQATGEYATLMGRGQVAGVLAATCSGAVAAPIISVGGFAAVGAASVVASVLASVVAILFPEYRIRKIDEPELSWADTLAAGTREARRSAPVRAAVILVAVVGSVWGALDEYTPLLIESGGVSAADVSLLMVVVWAGASAGGLAAGRVARWGSTAFAALVGVGAVLMAAGALTQHPLGVVALAAAFGVFNAPPSSPMPACRTASPDRPGRPSPRWRACRPTSRRSPSTAATPRWSISAATRGIRAADASVPGNGLMGATSTASRSDMGVRLARLRG